MLRVLTLSTLFPDATRPNLGLFVERQTRELASRPGIDLKVVAPIGLLPAPLGRVRPGDAAAVEIARAADAVAALARTA